MHDFIICPKCGLKQKGNIDCPRCGIVFAKYKRRDYISMFKCPSSVNDDTEDIPDSTDRRTRSAGKFALIGLMAFFFFYMVIKRSTWCFLDNVNLPFHEFGHIMFRPFGDTLQFLGGTISQLMWPFILTAYFIKRKECLSASFCVFWFGENFLNISKYIADARSMGLPLVGGGIHDWNHLLGKWNVLSYDNTIAGVIFVTGVLLMSGSILWALLAKPKKIDSVPL